MDPSTYGLVREEDWKAVHDRFLGATDGCRSITAHESWLTPKDFEAALLHAPGFL